MLTTQGKERQGVLPLNRKTSAHIKDQLYLTGDNGIGANSTVFSKPKTVNCVTKIKR